MGTPYVWDGEQPGGFDCSGFVKWAFAQVGVDLVSFAWDQWRVAEVSASHFRPGDLVFFVDTYDFAAEHPNLHPRVTHVGIMLQSRHFISATPAKGVGIDSLDDSYWTKHFLCFGSVIP